MRIATDRLNENYSIDGICQSYSTQLVKLSQNTDGGKREDDDFDGLSEIHFEHVQDINFIDQVALFNCDR